MEATAVSLARSVLDGVLSSAGAAVADEVARLLGVPREVDFIRGELEMMRSFLRVASAHPEAAAARNDTVRTWVKQVRDLAHDVEDCLLDFALYADRASASRAGSWLPGAVAERRRIAARIRDLRASVEALNQRNLRYHIAAVDRDGRCSLHAHAAAPRAEEQPPPVVPVPDQDDDASSAELAFLEADIVGRRDDKEELTRMISGGGRAVGVVSVWGMGGMGKTSLVRTVHNDPVLLDEFDCGAWITVPHPLDSADAFRRRLRKELGLQAPDQNVAEYLREKRYLVVVDDLHSQEEWEIICQVFLFHNHQLVENRKGSRIIVTTRREDVARHCAGHVAGWHGQVYELKPLEERESMDLLCQKVSPLLPLLNLVFLLP
jgi:hypothetical protein